MHSSTLLTRELIIYALVTMENLLKIIIGPNFQGKLAIWGGWVVCAGYFRKGKSRVKWLEKRKSFKNQRQPAAEIGILQVENSIIIYCFSQILHFLTDLIRYFAIFSSK